MTRLRPLAALVRPESALDSPPSLTVAFVAVLLVGAVSGAGLFATAIVLDGAIDRTVAVPNENRPPEWVCSDESPHDELSFDGCEEPPQVEVDLGAHARRVVTSWAMGAPIAFLALWPTFAGAFHLLTGRDGSYREVLSVSAFGFVPAALVWVARPVYLIAAGVSVPPAESPEAMTAAVRETVFGHPPALLAVGIVSLAWQAHVFAGGVRAAKGVARVVAYAVAVGTLGLAFLVAAIPRSVYEPAAVLFLVVGAPLLLFPRQWIDRQKRFELIGFRNADAVEPEEWYVGLHRLGGVLVFGLALAFLGGYRYLG